MQAEPGALYFPSPDPSRELDAGFSGHAGRGGAHEKGARRLDVCVNTVPPAAGEPGASHSTSLGLCVPLSEPGQHLL